MGPRQYNISSSSSSHFFRLEDIAISGKMSIRKLFTPSRDFFAHAEAYLSRYSILDWALYLPAALGTALRLLL
jgi:hypothetical protein